MPALSLMCFRIPSLPPAMRHLSMEFSSRTFHQTFDLNWRVGTIFFHHVDCLYRRSTRIHCGPKYPHHDLAVLMDVGARDNLLIPLSAYVAELKRQLTACALSVDQSPSPNVRPRDFRRSVDEPDPPPFPPHRSCPGTPSLVEYATIIVASACSVRGGVPSYSSVARTHFPSR